MCLQKCIQKKERWHPEKSPINFSLNSWNKLEKKPMSAIKSRENGKKKLRMNAILFYLLKSLATNSHNQEFTKEPE